MQWLKRLTFIIIDDAMTDFNWREKYDDFDALEDIEVLAEQQNWCMIRTRKLMPTLRFMQDAGRKIRELMPDDEYISGIKFETNILTYYKPKNG